MTKGIARNDVPLLAAYVAVNLLFVFKYGLRLMSFWQVSLAAVCYTALVVAVWRWGCSIILRANRAMTAIIVFAAVAAMLVLQYALDPMAIRVDRWSAIHNFLGRLMQGEYPYAAQTHLGGYGSPFPVWQILHLPFYLLGNVGFSIFAGGAYFLYAVHRSGGRASCLQAFILLLLSPAFIYEVAVRSDLVTLFLVCCGLMFGLHRRGVRYTEHPVLVGIVAGLLLSTRVTAIIPLVVFYLEDAMRSGLRRQAVGIIVALTTFVLTFLPFLLWNGEMLLFFEHNPFALQSRQGSVWDVAVVTPIVVAAAWWWRGSLRRYSASCAACLILLVAVAFAHRMWYDSSWLRLFDSPYDITYFNMSLPFLIAALSTQKRRSVR